MTTDTKENTSALEALDFAIVCQVVYYEVHTKFHTTTFKVIDHCKNTAKFIATIHDPMTCKVIKKPVCFECVNNGTWKSGCEMCDLDNVLLDLEPM